MGIEKKYKDLDTLDQLAYIHPYVSIPDFIVWILYILPSRFLTSCSGQLQLSGNLDVSSTGTTFLFYTKWITSCETYDSIHRESIFFSSWCLKASMQWANPSANLAWASPFLLQLVIWGTKCDHTCDLRKRWWCSAGRWHGGLGFCSWSLLSCSASVHSSMSYFCLTTDCYWVHLTSWLGSFNRTQLTMDSYRCMITCPTVKFCTSTRSK